MAAFLEGVRASLAASFEGEGDGHPVHTVLPVAEALDVLPYAAFVGQPWPAEAPAVGVTLQLLALHAPPGY